MKKTSKLILFLLSLALILSAAGCGGGGTTPPSQEPSSTPEAKTGADLVLKNGQIQTMVSENDVAQAIAIQGNEIIYVGDDAGAESFVGDNTEVIDLAGQFVSPGFMDGHLHGPEPYYEEMFQICIPEGTATNEEYLAIIKEFVDSHPDMDVYTGGPFMQNAYMQPDGSNPGPQKEDLDAICADKPIMIRDISHHAMWVNSKALEMGGITKDTPDPDGGRIVRNADGEPSGLLTDAGAGLVTSVVKVEYSLENMVEAYRAFVKNCNAYGITGFADINTHGEEILHAQALGTLDKEDALSLRTKFLVWADIGMKYEGVKKLLDEVAKYESDMLKTGTVKISYDGVTEGGTAVMIEPYLESAGKGSDWYGTIDWPDDEFFNLVSDLNKNGYQSHVHAIGDKAVQKTLDAYEYSREQNGDLDSRNSIVHVCAITDADIKRAADLKVVNNLQFLWMYADPLYELEAAFVGTERAMAFYPTKNMMEAGCIISGGSDGMMPSYNPLLHIEAGVTRNSPYPGEEDTDMYRWKEQALTAYQMLEIYTKNVAYQNHMDDVIGTIEVGKLADLVVLSDNILKVDPKQISDTQIVYTISDGKIVYSA